MFLAFTFTNILTLLLFLVIICGVIAIHEAGHLVMAKKFNVYCYEYSIGFGKAFYRNKKHETHFVLRCVPLGGFVKMAGEEGTDENGEVLDNNGVKVPDERLLNNIPKGKKILVMAAGGIMNLLLAFVCFFIFIVSTGIPYYSNNVDIKQDSKIYNLGIRSEDKVNEISTYLKNDADNSILVSNKTYTIEDKNGEEIVSAFNYAVPTDVGQTQYIEIKYVNSLNEDKVINLTRVIQLVEDKKVMETLGISITQDYEDYNFFQAIPRTFKFMGEYFVQLCKAFGQLFIGKTENLSGLVGIYQVVDQAATTSNANVIYLIGAISFSLGFFNLIPFPALDGGRIFFVLLECITKKKINPNVEATIHSVGIILLFGLMIFINVRDVVNIFR